MTIRELGDFAAPELLSQRFEGRLATPGLFTEDHWCSDMTGSGAGGRKDFPARKSGSIAAEPVCGKLRVLFDVADQPMPESLASLADRLDAAFLRGELSGSKAKGR